ncbi:MAG: UvrD-helicase domain-containing protein [Cyanobacteria bacterium]|nr:UvrD-helicase domain-containing protein [Cyanobacteriota bacterium]
MSPRLQPFEANSFPLDCGIRLLEASAGTGKTFALAHLVLRLVTEEGLSLRRLLVVTYTEAAAAELRDRIGRRLQEALASLEGGHQGSRVAAVPATAVAVAAAVAVGPAPEAASVDPVLHEWLERLHRQGTQPVDRLRGMLLLALEELDGADITTIHGFCRRTLERQSLEAGCSPQQRLEGDASRLIEEVVHDYWQRQVLPLSPPCLAGLGACGVSPEALASLLLRLDGDPALALDPLPAGLELEVPFADQWPALWQHNWSQFRNEWDRRSEALQQDFEAAAEQWHSATGAKTGSYSRRFRQGGPRAKVEAWLAQAEAQVEAGDYEAVQQQKELTDIFHPGAFSHQARKVEGHGLVPSLPQRPLLEAVAALVDGPAEALLAHACHWGRRELRQRRQRGGATSFAGLLEALDPGVDSLGEGTPLLAAVAARYDAALIDEFQDTDPIQWRILRQAFGAGGHRLVMVGDPKQAIYRFRGGDLATYLAARGEAGALYQLEENRRSTAELIDGLNRLLAPGLVRSGLEVPAVLARADRSGPPGPAIEVLWLGPKLEEEEEAEGMQPEGKQPKGKEPEAKQPEGKQPEAKQPKHRAPSRTEWEGRLPGLIAAATADLLARRPLVCHGGQSRPLGPEDICLLVSRHRQAEALRQALQRQGLASRLVSQADVFATAGATFLQRFLDALADPADPNRLRLLAASPLIGWSARTVQAADPGRWSALAGRLQALAAGLERRGLLGVLADLLGSDNLARLSGGEGRSLADLEQVAGLAERQRHAEGLGPAALADWLRRLRHSEDRPLPDDHQANSDRIDGAVAVVTIHRSKGLQFPVVICPYLWQAPGASRGAGAPLGCRWQPPNAAQPHLDLHLDRRWGLGYAAHSQERASEQAEAERLAYVAMTRAEHLLVLAWGPVAQQGASPLLPWLFPEEPLAGPDHDPLAGSSALEWRRRLEHQLAQRALPVRLMDPPPAPGEGQAAVGNGAPPLALGPVPQRPFDRRWGRASYTGWTHGAPEPGRSVMASGVAPQSLEEGRDTLDPSTELEDIQLGAAVPSARPLSSPQWPDNGPLADFPRGAAAGDCLHRILEGLDYSIPWQPDSVGEQVQAELRRAGLASQPLEPLLAGLEQVRLTPFGGPLGGLRLADLAAGQWLNEMNFDLTLGSVRAKALAAAFADHPGGPFGADYANQVAQLPIASRGFLTGSIDLLFQAPDPAGRGRWWVLDWKSNWLGRRDSTGRPVACGPSHYDRGAMAALMAANHYPLQAHLYLVALHRYLGWRQPDYQPERDLGGYAYAFLRGAPGPVAPQDWDAGAAGSADIPGMVVECPPVGRLLALDGALAAPERKP